MPFLPMDLRYAIRTLRRSPGFTLVAVLTLAIVKWASGPRSGATDRSILRLVLDRGVLLTAIGLIIDVRGALARTRLMASLLYGTSARDPMIASYIPARRATKVDPIVAMHWE